MFISEQKRQRLPSQEQNKPVKNTLVIKNKITLTIWNKLPTNDDTGKNEDTLNSLQEIIVGAH